MRLFFLTTLVVLSMGCAAPGGSGSPIFLLPSGSEIRLAQDIEATRGARIFIQFGRVLPLDALDQHAPHCFFHVERTQTEMRDSLRISRETFIVTRSFQQSDYVGLEGVQLASGMDSNRSLSTVMELAAVQGFANPKFICTKLGSKSRDGFVTLSQMQETLGSMVQLIPKG